MRLRTNDRVVFNEMLHEYLLDGEKVLVGVTSMMHRHGLDTDFSMVDEATLRHAAELGTEAHRAIEAYCNGEAVEMIPLIKSFSALHIKPVCCEYLVSDNETVASSIDIVAEGDGMDEVILIDMKRRSAVDYDALAWQLGIYKYLFEMANPDIRVAGCYGLHIKKGNRDDILKDTCAPLRPVEPVDGDRVAALIAAERLGYTYSEAHDTDITVIGDAGLMADYTSKVREVTELKARLKELEDGIKEYEDAIYNEMVSKDVDTCEVDGGTIKLKKPYTKSSFDTKTFKGEFPDLYTRFLKTTEVKGNITFKEKEL